MKKSFRGYNVKETDSYIEQLKNEYESRISELERSLENTNAENETYKQKIKELEENAKSVSGILIDAVQHAQQIELDYKNRARQSDEHYSKMANEWEHRMNACKDSIVGMRNAAKEAYNDLVLRIDEFEVWSNNNLISSDTEFQSISTNSTEDNIINESDELQNRILSETNVDLTQACNDLGITNED